MVLIVAALVEMLSRRAVPAEPPRIPVATAVDHAWVRDGILHEFDRLGFRRDEAPFARKGDRLRIAALGDSFTYGQGVEAGAAWPAVLATSVGAEVLNLGRCGANSHDVLVYARAMWTRQETPHLARLRGLNPDRIVYAVCMNDAQPSHMYGAWAEWMGSRWGAARIVARLLAPSFQEDVERRSDWGRFREDIAGLRALGEERGVPVAVSVFDDMGLDALRARFEREIRAAGVEPVPFALPAGRWTVAPWDGHPNAEAHRRFAETIAEVL